MALSISYSATQLSSHTLPFAIDSGDGSDVVGLSNGGTATIALDKANGDFDAITIFDAAGDAVGSTRLIQGTDGKIAQLADGNIVAIATSDDQFASNINYYIQTPDAGEVATGNIIANGPAATPEYAKDLAALTGGGFVVVGEQYFPNPNNPSPDYDITVHVRDATGGVVTDFRVDTSTATDMAPSVAGLNDGGFAVTWSRGVDEWVAVYNANGTVRSAPHLFDNKGLNGATNMTALKNGGFAVTYADTGWTNSDLANDHSNITLATFDAQGNFQKFIQESSLSGNNLWPDTATLSNGLVLSTFTDWTGNNNTSHNFATLANPATGAALTDISNPLTLETGGLSASSVTALDHAQFVVDYGQSPGWGDVTETQYQLVRHVTGDSANDVFHGDDAVDIIKGGGGKDSLNGGANADVLVGGSDADKFWFDADALADAKAAAPLVDHVTDYDQGNSGVFDAAEGDQIELPTLLSTAYNLGNGQPVDTLVRAVETLSGADLQIDPDGAANGTNWVTIAHLDGLHVGNSVNVVLDPSLPAGTTINIAPFATDDFNFDGKGDIMLRNDDGRISLWEMDGAAVSKAATAATPLLDSTWHNVDTGDFNHDGHADILLRNDDGRLSVWGMDGYSLLQSGTINTGNLLDSSWHNAGTGDFNNDGNADILLRNDDGRVSLWEMNGLSVAQGATINSNNLLDATWHVAATGDFNADGNADIVLRNDDGRVSVWEMSGFSLLQAATVNPGNNLDPTWHIAGTGDFNADGFSDILLRNDDGRVSIWEMNGLSIANAATANTPLLDSSWHIVGTDDVNGDNKSDILLRNDDGRVSVWEMDGNTLVNGVTVNSGNLLDNTWHVENHQHDLA